MAPKQRKKQQSAAKSAQLRGRQGSSFASCTWCKTSVAGSLLTWHLTECASYLHQRRSEGLQKLNLEENARVEDLKNRTSMEAEGREVESINLDEPYSPWSCQDDAVRVLHNKDDPIRVFHSEDDAVMVLQNIDSLVKTSQNIDDAVMVSQNEGDAVKVSQSKDDPVWTSENIDDAVMVLQNIDSLVKTSQNIDDAVMVSQNEGDAVKVSQSKDDPVRTSENIDDAVTVSQSKADAVKVLQNKNDPVRASQNMSDAIMVSQNEGDAITVLQNKDDSVTASQNIDDAVMFSQNEGDAVMLLQNKDDPVRALHTKDDAVMVLQNTDDAITVFRNKDDTITVLQNKEGLVGVLHEKHDVDRVFQNKDDDAVGVWQDKDNPVRVLQASSAVAESKQAVENPECIPSMQDTDFTKSTQFTSVRNSMPASEGLSGDSSEEKVPCCKCRESLLLHGSGSIERSPSESAACKRDYMPLGEGPEADEAISCSFLKDALTKLESEHNALICLQEATEKKNQELLLRVQESQRELWLLQQRHEEALKSLQSMKEKLESLSVPSSTLKENKLSVQSLEKDLIGSDDCATTTSDLQRTEYCNGSINMKKAYEVVDCFIDEVQSDEVGSPPHERVLTTVDSVEGTQQLEGPSPRTSNAPTVLKGRAAMIEDMPGSHCIESYKKKMAIAGASSSVLELARQKDESTHALETCTDVPSQNAADSGLPLLTCATAVEKFSVPCMSPLTPDRRALFCCIGKDISEGKCTTLQSREGMSEAINKTREDLGPDTPEKRVPHVLGCHPSHTFTTSVPTTLTTETDVSCSPSRDKKMHTEEAPNANLGPTSLFSSAEAPAYLQRAKEPTENLQAARMDKDLVQRSAGKIYLLGSSPEDFFPAKKLLKDLESVAHEDLDNFGKAKVSMGHCHVRRHMIAESSDSESGRDATRNNCLSVLRPKKRAFQNRLDSENENLLAYSEKRIIAIPSDSESGEEDKGYLKDSSYCDPVISDEVLRETPVLKRLKKIGSMSPHEVINSQGVEEQGVAADKLGPSISKGEGHVFNIGGARRRRRRIFQDCEDQAGNSCHDRQQLSEELEEEEIDSHPPQSKTSSIGKSVVGKMQLPGTSDSCENPKGYWLRRFGKKRLTYSEAPILKDGSTGKSHGQKVQRHIRHDEEKVKMYVNLLKESSGSEGEDEIDEESEGESLKGFIVDETEESEDGSKPNLLSESRSTDGLEDNCSASDSELQCSSCSTGSSQNGKFNWADEAQFLAALGRDDELCLHAVCALYRQQTDSEQMNKSALIRNCRGFDRFRALKASVVAEFLTDGDSTGQLKKSVIDLKRHNPEGIEYCRDIAFHYSKQLFEIYQSGEDPYFCACR